MDIRKVKKLIEMLEESNLNEIEIKEGEEAVKLVKSNPVPSNFISSTPAIISEPTQQSPITKPSAPLSEATVTQEISQTSDVLESGNKMNSPMVGTFYSAPNPESEPFVKVGDQINEGDVLCIIEAMKMMNEVKSEFSGTVKQILVDNAEPVEFDQTLFVIS
ncbi:MAG: acetyl-CoA carboxylase biotin carboxyl carrier protein [Pseudomonadota bacterium]|jgi:acetyl-CoA carboxylase biotin carboxyl carrier protein|nr:acetyl-CoA carboxylase biotin carboxyl carrier protein [Pseudomonadota bacterium]|tara:strand:+ start:2631 stop:3116 length:486 start_codon:yes stop_codon:yes gene_type:complete